MRRFFIALLLPLMLVATSARAATFYISTTGSDSSSGAALSQAWRTFAHAWSVMRPGDTLLVGDGRYVQPVCPAQSGTAGNPITVRAVNDGAVVIDGQGSAAISMGGACSSWSSVDYVNVEGLVAINGGEDVVVIYGNNNILRRISAYNADKDDNSSVFFLLGTDNLVEDCVAGGYGRKMFVGFSSDVTSPRRNIFRRCFSAWMEWQGADFDPGQWPWGDGAEAYGSSSMIFENNIIYGVAPGPRAGMGANNQVPGSTVSNLGFFGNMTIRAGMNWGGGDMIWPCPSPFRNPSPGCTKFPSTARSGVNLDGTSFSQVMFQDIFSWGNGGRGLHISAGTSTNFSLSRGTILNNAIASGEDGVDATAETLAHLDTITDSFIEGTSHQGSGARLTYRYESGFANDVPVANLTNTELWPWPMEDRINREVTTYLYPTWGVIHPELQNFSVTSAMLSIFNSLPAGLNPLAGSSDSQAPTVPTSLSATAVSSSQIDLRWNPSSDNVSVAGYRVFRSDGQIATTTATSYSSSGLSPSTQYAYTLTAYDSAGNSSSPSAAINATTQPAGDTVPPSITVTAPSAGSILSGMVTLMASASDNVAVAGVQFRVDGASKEAEVTAAPFSVPLDVTTLSNGSHFLTARARDAAGNVAFSAAVEIIVDNPSQGSLAVSALTDNRSIYASSKVPLHSKLELTFQIANTVAVNYQLPYDPSPPPGVDPVNQPLHRGISVDGLFSPDGWQTIYRQPAFYHEAFQEAVKSSWDGTNREWHYPTGTFAWKVRFAPDRTGAWEYKIEARDASGTTESPVRSFSVTASTNPGFLRVSQKDPRYFEFDNGQVFTPVGVNSGADIADPISGNEPHYQGLSQNGINFQRHWISNLYGSAWLEWIGGRNLYDGYLPRAGLEPFHDPVTGLDQITQVLMHADPSGWYDPCRFQFWNDPESVKQNTRYKLAIKYWATDIAGPRLGGNFGLVGKISNSWVPDCQEPGSGTVVTDYGGDTSNWGVVEGTWQSGNYSFLPRIYLALENVTRGKVYVLSVSLREDLGGGQYGPEIIKQPSMQYDLYFPQEPSHSFDKVVELAELYGIYLKLVLSDNNDSIYHKLDDDGSFVIGGESDNLDGFYGLGRTMNKTRWLQQAWWRYVQARWGYSTAIHSWELTNEGDPFLTRHWELTDELGKFMRCRVFGVAVGNGNASTCADQHPNRHMVTTSFWHSFPGYSRQTGQGFWGNPNYPNVDYADLHAYVSTSLAPSTERALMEGDAAYYHLWHSKEYGNWDLGMPIVRGEAGIDLADSHGVSIPGFHDDIQGTWYHNYVWSSMDSWGLSEMYWWFTPDVYDPGVRDHRPVARSFQNFMSGVSLNNGHYKDLDAEVSHPDLRVAGQKDLVNAKAHLWIQNRNHTWRNVVNSVSIAPVSGTVRIGGFVPGRSYTVQWWDTSDTGSQVSSATSATAAGDGRLTLQVVQLAADVAVKISGSAVQSRPEPPRNLSIQVR